MVAEKPMQFKLKLRKSAFDYKLRALEKYRIWFPPPDFEFEIVSQGKGYKTYVDRMSRLRLHTWLADNPEARVGDYLVFTPLSEGRQWMVSLEQSPVGRQTSLGPEEQKPRKRRVSYGHEEIQQMIVDLCDHYSMFADTEVQHDPYVYDVVWRRVESGNPVKVFEVQVHGSLDSAFAKLKHARDTWNSDLFLIVSTTKDAEKAQQLLSGSFHEIKNKLTILRDSEVYEMLVFKDRFGGIEQSLSR